MQFSFNQMHSSQSKTNLVQPNAFQSVQIQLISTKSIQVIPKPTWFIQIQSSQSKTNLYFGLTGMDLDAIFFQPNAFQSVYNQPGSTKSSPVSPNPTYGRSGWLSVLRRCLARKWPGFDFRSRPDLRLEWKRWLFSVTLRQGARFKVLQLRL
jgi:hypothetical protein